FDHRLLLRRQRLGERRDDAELAALHLPARGGDEHGGVVLGTGGGRAQQGAREREREAPHGAAPIAGASSASGALPIVFGASCSGARVILTPNSAMKPELW